MARRLGIAAKAPYEVVGPYDNPISENFDVVVPKGNELQLDIDTIKDMRAYEEGVELLENSGFYVREVKRTVSPGGNTHIYLEIDSLSELTAEQRIAMQAALGSDRKRELISMMRVFRGVTPPTALFETKSDILNDDDIPF